MTSQRASTNHIILETPGTRLTARQQFRRRAASYAMAPGPFDRKFIAFMISVSGVGKTDCVVELACGSGTTTLGFAERCGHAIGVDVAEEPLQRARTAAAERGIRNVDFILSEVERLSFDDGSFNGALCRFSFHHFVNPARVFAELARVVGAGGWMVIADMVASEDPAKAELLERMFAEQGFRAAMKVERDARLTLEDWIRFGGASPENAAELRELAAAAVDQDGAGLRFTRDGDQIRLIHNSVSFVIEKE